MIGKGTGEIGCFLEKEYLAGEEDRVVEFLKALNSRHLRSLLLVVLIGAVLSPLHTGHVNPVGNNEAGALKAGADPTVRVAEWMGGQHLDPAAGVGTPRGGEWVFQQLQRGLELGFSHAFSLLFSSR